MTTASEAIARIETEFPELAEPMHDEINDGLLHLQIGEFSRLAQGFIDAQDRSGFDRVCRLFLDSSRRRSRIWRTR